MNALKTRIASLVDKTRDAWSFDRYGEAEWRRAVRLLIDRGLGDQEIEAILRSKWTRWAADCAKHYSPRGDDLITFMNDPRNHCTSETIAELVAGS